MTNDPNLIQTEEQLREVIGPERPELRLKVRDQLDEFAIAFLEKSPFMILSTADADGNVDASPKGDGPGFVHVEDDRTILIPDRPGNKLVFGHLNILSNPRVGTIFMIPGTNETLRLSGRAELTRDPELLENLAGFGKPAILAIRVHIEECFFHCAKAFLRSKLWRPQDWPEKHRVSFGEMHAKRTDADPGTARAIDQQIERDYTKNL